MRRRLPSWRGFPKLRRGKGRIASVYFFAAVHLAKRGIRVDAVSGGFVPRRKCRKMLQLRAPEQDGPLSRVAHLQNQGAVLFLASPAVSYITGHSLWSMDGGGLVAMPAK